MYVEYVEHAGMEREREIAAFQEPCRAVPLYRAGRLYHLLLSAHPPISNIYYSYYYY